MRFHIITIFPHLFDSFLSESLIKRAQHNGHIEILVHNLRDYTTDKHKTVDDTPYGGGPGMLLKPEPIFKAVRAIVAASAVPREQIRVILLTPQGQTFTQQKAQQLAAPESAQEIIFICGRYEGFDERIRTHLVDEQISIGDYVLQGGEIPAMAIIEAVSRLIPGVLGDEESAQEESFSQSPDYLEYPQYTKPAEFEGLAVPEVLQNGDHKKIGEWRRANSRRKK